MSTERDRMTSPSINYPRSPEEAFQALVHHVRHVLFEHASGGPPTLGRDYTIDSGLGTTRSPEAAQWLNEQQSLLKARLEDFLDELDHSVQDTED